LARTLRVPAVLIALALVGWILSARTMGGMDGMEIPSLASFLWLWVAMSAAMMLPALVPAASLASALGRSCVGFVAGYFTVWAATGLPAFIAERRLMVGGTWLAAGALVVAAAYQITPLKDVCLRSCRSPLGLLMRRDALRAGVEHGVVCLGCCWALMLALLALGSASLVWMACVSLVIFLEKVTIGRRASVPIALGLLMLAAGTVL
jgi:predicted metal-binding membrane protein